MPGSTVICPSCGHEETFDPWEQGRYDTTFKCEQCGHAYDPHSHKKAVESNF